MQFFSPKYSLSMVGWIVGMEDELYVYIVRFVQSLLE